MYSVTPVVDNQVGRGKRRVLDYESFRLGSFINSVCSCHMRPPWLAGGKKPATSRSGDGAVSRVGVILQVLNAGRLTTGKVRWLRARRLFATVAIV